MPDPVKKPRYKVGDTVRIHVLPSKLIGTVTEVTYVPSGSGRISYRIRVPMDPEPLWMPVREEHIEKVDSSEV